MQTITINVLAATKNRDQVLETKVNGIRHTRLRFAKTEGAGVDAKHFAEAIFRADNRYKVGNLISNVPTCGKRIVRTIVYEVLTVVTATPTMEPTTDPWALLAAASSALIKAQSDYHASCDQRDQARRAKWEADQAFEVADMTARRLLKSFDEARKACNDAAFLAR
jgi:hypothetical protein